MLLSSGLHARGILVAACVAMLLTGCSGQSIKPVAGDPYAWQRHQQQLAHLANWSFKGRLAIKQPGDSWSASLSWQQDGPRYDIQLSGAFGQGAARLFGSDGHAVIETPDHAAITSTSAELLMEEQLGWYVPLDGLKYWLLGSPAPVLAERQQLDQFGRLLEMEQSGWQIRYRGYITVDGVDLPRKLELENSRLRARLVIDAWQLKDGEEA